MQIGFGIVKNLFKVPNVLYGLCVNIVRNIKIQKRLIISFITISLVPLAITGVMTYIKSSRVMESKIRTYSVQILNEVRDNIQFKMEKVEYASDQIYVSEMVQEIISQSINNSEDYNLNAIRSVNSFLQEKYSIINDVTVAQIMSNNGIIYTGVVQATTAGQGYADRLADETDKLRATALKHKGASVWLLPFSQELNENVFVIRTVNSLVNDKPLGTLIVAVKNGYLSSAFKDIDIEPLSDIFILNSSGIVVSSTKSKIPVGEKYFDSTLIQDIKANEGIHNANFLSSIASQKHLTAFAKIRNTDWYLVNTVPYFYVNSESYRIGLYILAISVVCLVVSVFLSYLISGSISKPLMKLVKAMNDTKHGNLSVTVIDDRRDELAEVADNFNNMVREINMLVLNVKKNEKQKRFAELEALQAQINPHFLSNTLNNIKWMANVQKADNIKNVVTSLIHLINSSVGKGTEFTSVSEEVDYVKNYLNIQEYRYYNKFKVHFEIEDRALNLFMPKMLVQPIVENSLIHGIEPLEGQGMIVMKAYIEDSSLKVTVMDNGVGMDKEAIQKVLSDDYSSKSRLNFSGIGIYNVNERIKLYFGESYGLSIQSIPDLYTTVEFKIPVISEREIKDV